MESVVHPKYQQLSKDLDHFILNFDSLGQAYGNQNRNSLKVYELNGLIINTKSFKVPNWINQVVYKYFRKSKAQRSFEYANVLIEKEVGTPQPIAYYELPTTFLFKKSYYLSEQLESDYTYRELTTDFEIPRYDEILRAFTRFTYGLHEKEIHFLDHSPGNTLIKIHDEEIEFFLVDLNRMEFKPLNFEERIRNFSRLTTHKSMVEVMSDEYSKCINKPFGEVFDLMWKYTVEFQEKFNRKKRIKKKLKFWKKN